MKLRQTILKVFMLLLLTSSSVSAQTLVTVGTATGTNGTGEASPINIYYKSMHFQVVYTVTELQTAGFVPGDTIKELGWDVTGAPIYALPNYTIRMDHTTNTNASTNIPIAGMTQVYNSASYTPTAGGFDMLVLSTPFVWNGTDNIVIDVCFDLLHAYDGSGQVSIYNATSGSRFERSDFNPMCGVNTTTTLETKPVVQFLISTGPAPNCAMVDYPVTVNNVTAFTADITWTHLGTPVSYIVEYGPVGFTPGTGITVTPLASPALLTNLNPTQDYTARVQAVCGTAVGDTSIAGFVNFTTPCPPFTAPYTENFSSGATPNCWSQTAVVGGPWQFTGNPDYDASGLQSHTADGSHFAWVDFSAPTDQQVVLELNAVDVSALPSAALSFWHYSNFSNYPSSSNNFLYVQAQDAGGNWNTLDAIQQNNPDWQFKLYDLGNHINNGLVKVRFMADYEGTGTAYYNDLAIDDVSISSPPLGSSGNPFTSLDQAAEVTSAGIYYFNIGGNTFDTYVDANGFVQVAIDFGNGVGDLPQGTSLTTATRGILNPTTLAALTETSIVRISSSTGNFDVTSTDATIISRVQNNTTLHQGAPDNAINDSWIGTNAIYITADATCPTGATSLHENIAHGCGNGDLFHWIPINNDQMERFIDGDIPDAEFFQLWVRSTAEPACALNFDGIDDYVNCGSAINISNQSFTIEFWAKQDDLGSNYIIYQGNQAVNEGLHIGFRDASSFTFAFYANDLDVGGVDLQWHHWACVYEANTSGTDRFIYRDGTLVGSDDANGSFTGSGTLVLGKVGWGNEFKGRLDEVRIWNTARSSTEINAYKDCELTGNETGLLAYYKFNQGITNYNNSSETTLNDATSNNNNGTLTNFTLSGSTSNWTSSCGVTSDSICTPLLGSSGNPFTSLDQAAEVTSAGIYYFNIGGNTFDTYVDANGFVQVAIDFGNGVGNLPQGTSLTTATRGILNPTILATLTETQTVRISSSTGNFDVTSTDPTIISRVQSNTTLHQGTPDNAVNDSWIGTNAIYITTDAACPSGGGTSLQQNIVHVCGNIDGTGTHWNPIWGGQRESYIDGEIPDADYFQLWVKSTASAAPLPVELIYFQGKANDNQIQLNWETASELNNSGFEIHKSNNGKDWETIDFVVGQGTTIEVSNYQYEDQNPLIGTNYYRLKQLDFDGAFEYSKTIAVGYNIEESNIIIFPNPSNGIVNLQINNPSNQSIQIKIFDNLGRIIRDSEIIEGEANWQQEMVIKEKGIYTVAIQIGNEIVYKRIIIAD